MNPRRLGAMIRKEFIHFRRDARSLLLALLMPMLLIGLFGWALSLDINNVPTAVYDQSATPLSRELISYLDGSPYITVTHYTHSYHELEELVDHGRVTLCVVIPADFAAAALSGRSTELQVLADGADANTAALALNYVQSAALLYGAQLTARQAVRGQASPAAPALDMRARAFYNPTLRSQNFIVPGLIGLIMMVIAALLTSLTVAREWELGTMEQLISTPVRGAELIVGKLVPYWVVGMLDVLIAMALGYFVFHVPMEGSVLTVVAISAVFLLGALSIGMLMSINFKNQMLASQMALMATYLPTLFLAGFMFSIANMPRPLQLVSAFVPARYFIALVRAVYLKGAGLELIGGQALLLLAFSAVMFAVCLRRFKKRLA